MKWLWAAMAIVAVVTVGPAIGQESGIGITIHAEGTLSEVKQMLRDEHRMYLSLHGDFDEDTPVTLDLDGATRLQLVRDLCQQIGAVYKHSGSGLMDHWILRKGDLGLDPRPTTMAGPYAVSIREIVMSNTRSLEFRLGAEEGEANEHTSLQVRFDVEPPTAAAEELLYGVWPQASIVTDTGERLINVNGVARSYPVHRLDIHGGSGAMGLSFMLPNGSPTRITQLNGVVAAYREVTRASCQFSMGETGVTKQFGDVGCKLTGWDRLLLKDVLVSFEMPAGTGNLEDKTMRLRARLMGPNEETVLSSGRREHRDDGKAMVTLTFHNVAWEPVELSIEATVWHGPMQWHNFVIEHIPLP